MTTNEIIEAQTAALGSTTDTLMAMHPDLQSVVVIATYKTPDGAATSSASRGNHYATIGATRDYLRSLGQL